MLEVIKSENSEKILPISVIVPLSKNRNDFFNKMVYPLLKANNPAEIIINRSQETAPQKRNMGFKKSNQPYIFFLDDDILLPADHLLKLYNELKTQELRVDKKIGFTYSGYNGIVLFPKSHPLKNVFKVSTLEYNPATLRETNYISTMSLIKREIFPGFDEKLQRFQDWDVYLNLLMKGIEGKAVFNNDFYAFYLDNGISSHNNEIIAYNAIIKKYNLRPFYWLKLKNFLKKFFFGKGNPPQK